MENKNRYGALDLVRSPDDLRTMSVEVKQTLCANIREFLIDHVSRTGGHLAVSYTHLTLPTIYSV